MTAVPLETYEWFSAEFNRLAGGLSTLDATPSSSHGSTHSLAVILERDTPFQRDARKKTVLALLRKMLRRGIGTSAGVSNHSSPLKDQSSAEEALKRSVVSCILTLWSSDDVLIAAGVELGCSVVEYDILFQTLTRLTINSNAVTINMSQRPLCCLAGEQRPQVIVLPGSVSSAPTTHSEGQPTRSEEYAIRETVFYERKTLEDPQLSGSSGSSGKTSNVEALKAQSLPETRRNPPLVSSSVDKDAVVDEVRRSIQLIRNAAARLHENLAVDSHLMDRSEEQLSAAVSKTKLQTKTVNRVSGSGKGVSRLAQLPLLSRIPGFALFVEMVLVPLWAVVRQMVLILLILAVVAVTLSVVVYVPRAYVHREYFPMPSSSSSGM
eukprot:CAMPEP_0176415314 /NCGR_PEP_ID=MMETSP0127-20121128/5741_1 /TAXON_ID=938130 /ORGANISM="Platyophrya macrostoma, Strain WH" /LENGTH=379 /DNA_ID=CAMNT_0017795303 /DNA_START=85 /DNA_END=1224 /DNA_ORIENTATION=+